MRIKRYLKLWLKTSSLSLEEIFATWFSSLMFIMGKLLRFIFFIFSIIVILKNSSDIAGFSFKQMINFFLVFNLLDIMGQFFFRGIYWFKYKIVSGSFDLILIKPVSSLFQVLTCYTDFLDLPLLLIVIFFLYQQNNPLDLLKLALFFLLVVSSFLIIAAIHILVAAVGVITVEIDHIIWVYRDLSEMARVPVDIYHSDFLRFFLTFIIPIALIFTFPAKALMGLLSFKLLFFVFCFALFFFFLSLRLWRIALKRYSSASS